MTQSSCIDGLPDLPKPRAHAFSMEYSGPIFDTDQMNTHGLACYEAGSAAAAQAAKQVPAGWQYSGPNTRNEWWPCDKAMSEWASEQPDYSTRQVFAAAPSATSLAEAAALCACGDRPATECDEEWGPKCDLGNNAAHAQVSTTDPALIDAALAAPEAAEAGQVKAEPGDCPHAAPFRYCPQCVVSPCPIGLGDKK